MAGTGQSPGHSSHTRPGAPAPSSTGSGPLRGLTSRDAKQSWVLMTSGGQLPGHQISSRKAGPYGEPPEPRAAERSSHCPGSVPSRTLRAADPPTCSGPEALASDLRGLARALATTQGCVGDRASQQAASASRALLSLPSASRSVGLAAWEVTGGHAALQSHDTAAGQDSCRDRQVPGVQPWALSWQADPSPGQVGGAPLGPTPSSQPLQETLAHPTLGLPVTPTPPPSVFWVILSRFQARLTAKRGRFQGPGVCVSGMVPASGQWVDALPRPAP